MILLNESNAILIDCKFGDEIINSWDVRYTCKVREFNVKDDDRSVQNITGKHETKELAMTNVTQFTAKGHKVEHVRIRQTKIFKINQ